MLSKNKIKIGIGILFCLLAMSSCGPPLCPMQSRTPGVTGCKVRAQHYHGGELFRGMPWYKKQHLRVGEKYKHPYGKPPKTKAPNPQAGKQRKTKQKIIVQ